MRALASVNKPSNQYAGRLSYAQGQKINAIHEAVVSATETHIVNVKGEEHNDRRLIDSGESPTK